MSKVAGRFILVKGPFKKDIYLSVGEKEKNTLNIFIDPMNFECVEEISK